MLNTAKIFAAFEALCSALFTCCDIAIKRGHFPNSAMNEFHGGRSRQACIGNLWVVQ